MGDISAFYHLTKPAAVLRATGPDAFTFLQSQFSNDLRRPGVERPVTYGLWLDQKGKIQADSFILQRGPAEFLLVSYDCPVEKIRAHLEAHLIADEVELKDETGEFGLMHTHVLERNSAEAEYLLAGAPPAGVWVAMVDAEHSYRWPGRRPTTAYSSRAKRQPAWDYLGPPEVLEKEILRLKEHGIGPTYDGMIEAYRLTAGIPAVPVDAGPGDLPQEAGLERDAVSFDKGCYLGQEVMARLKSQGHVNRALWRVLAKKDMQLAGNMPKPLYAGEVLAGELRSRAGAMGIAMLKKRAIAGREGLSLTPGGNEVISLRAEDGGLDLTQPPTLPADQS